MLQSMEEAMSECLQREGLLRADLDAAMVKIATLITDREHSDDVIAEGCDCYYTDLLAKAFEEIMNYL